MREALIRRSPNVALRMPPPDSVARWARLWMRAARAGARSARWADASSAGSCAPDIPLRALCTTVGFVHGAEYFAHSRHGTEDDDRWADAQRARLHRAHVRVKQEGAIVAVTGEPGIARPVSSRISSALAPTGTSVIARALPESLAGAEAHCRSWMRSRRCSAGPTPTFDALRHDRRPDVVRRWRRRRRSCNPRHAERMKRELGTLLQEISRGAGAARHRRSALGRRLDGGCADLIWPAGSTRCASC